MHAPPPRILEWSYALVLKVMIEISDGTFRLPHLRNKNSTRLFEFHNKPNGPNPTPQNWPLFSVPYCTDCFNESCSRHSKNTFWSVRESHMTKFDGGKQVTVLDTVNKRMPEKDGVDYDIYKLNDWSFREVHTSLMNAFVWFMNLTDKEVFRNFALADFMRVLLNPGDYVFPPHDAVFERMPYKCRSRFCTFSGTSISCEALSELPFLMDYLNESINLHLSEQENWHKHRVVRAADFWGNGSHLNFQAFSVKNIELPYC